MFPDVGRVFFFFKQKTAYDIMPSLVGSEMCIRDREKGYEALELEYRRMPEHPFDNLKETAKTVCACAEAWAEHVDWEKYDKIAFVSKSVGTVAAGFLTRRLAETGGCVQIVNLFLTPIEPTLKYLTEAKNGTKMGSSQIVFSGTADQWMDCLLYTSPSPRD